MKTVFVSGCFDILHGGHVEFFRQARELGDRLIVCVPSDEVLFIHKKRNPHLPIEHKIHLLRGLELVDDVVVGGDLGMGLNFETLFRELKPDVLAVTDDDKFEDIKCKLCAEVGAEYTKLPKSLEYDPTSTTDIYRRLHAPAEAALRIDLAGGWLDVPRFARAGTYIVNCAISPLVSLHKWDYEECSGLGGSGAYAELIGKNGVESELNNGVGWQDPAISRETGLCIWRSGKRPVLEAKLNPEFLQGHMALYWTGKPHTTKDYVDMKRDFDAIAAAGKIACDAALAGDLAGICEAVTCSYAVQLDEGMDKLPELGEQAVKYCGGGHGGYAAYFFDKRPANSDLLPIEPYLRPLA
jgi:cytidyltransferase-like protein